VNKRQRKKRIKKLCDRFGLKWKQALSVEYHIDNFDVELNDKGEHVMNFNVTPIVQYVEIKGVIEV